MHCIVLFLCYNAEVRILFVQGTFSIQFEPLLLDTELSTTLWCPVCLSYWDLLLTYLRFSKTTSFRDFDSRWRL